MDSEANKAIVGRYFEMWNTGNVALAEQVLAPAYVDYAHPEITSLEGIKQAVRETRATFPDFHIITEDMVSEGDRVAVRATIHRTLQGNVIVSRVAWFMRIADGRMVEEWTYYGRDR